MSTPPRVPPKARGLRRLWLATRYSLAGLHTAWRGEAAFRQEAVAAAVLLPAAFWLGQGWLEVALLLGSLVLVLVVELLNSALEAVVDRAGPQWNRHAKRAKDMGSAAVMLALLLAAGIWLAALWHHFFTP